MDSSRLEEVLNDYYKEKAEKYGDSSCLPAFFHFQIKSVVVQLEYKVTFQLESEVVPLASLAEELL